MLCNLYSDTKELVTTSRSPLQCRQWLRVKGFTLLARVSALGVLVLALSASSLGLGRAPRGLLDSNFFWMSLGLGTYVITWQQRLEMVNRIALTR